MRKIFPVYLLSVLAAAALLGAPQPAAGAAALPQSLATVLSGADFSPADREVVAALCTQALETGIAAQDLETIVSRAVSGSRKAEELSQFLKTAVNVSRRGLPVQPVLDRVHLGLARGVSSDRIQASIRRMEETLSAAEPLVGELLKKGTSTGPQATREQAIITTARALEKGIAARLLTETGEAVLEKGKSLSLYDKAADSLTLLAEGGAEPAAGMHLIRKALDKGYGEGDFARLDREVAQDLAKGRSIDDILSRADARISGTSFGEGSRKTGDGAVRGFGQGPSGGGGFGGRMERRR